VPHVVQELLTLSEHMSSRPEEKNAKRRNNDLQAIAQKTKDRATRIALKTGGELMCSESVSTSCTT
jgi:hypothetical protein